MKNLKALAAKMTALRERHLEEIDGLKETMGVIGHINLDQNGDPELYDVPFDKIAVNGVIEIRQHHQVKYEIITKINEDLLEDDHIDWNGAGYSTLPLDLKPSEANDIFNQELIINADVLNEVMSELKSYGETKYDKKYILHNAKRQDDFPLNFGTLSVETSFENGLTVINSIKYSYLPESEFSIEASKEVKAPQR